MFETVAASVYYMWTTICYVLYVSYKIGEFLITTISVLLENVFIFINSLLELLIILLEAFTIFFQDIVQCFQQSCRIMSYFMEVVVSGISTTFHDVSSVVDSLILTVMTVYNFIVNSILHIGTVTGQMLIFFKRLIVLFGSGVWFSITFIPLLIVYLVTLCIHYLGRLLEETKDSVSTSLLAVRNILKHFYEFLTDVPAESIAGIVIGICLAYIVTQFYIILYSYMYDQFRNVFRYIQRRCNRLRRQRTHTVIQTTSRVRIVPRSRPQIREDPHRPRSSKDESPVDERYCVICQEQIKCILILPCRHVCMCNECSVRLQLYNNTCPICRNDIESTMKIFV